MGVLQDLLDQDDNPTFLGGTAEDWQGEADKYSQEYTDRKSVG